MELTEFKTFIIIMIIIIKEVIIIIKEVVIIIKKLDVMADNLKCNFLRMVAILLEVKYSF